MTIIIFIIINDVYRCCGVWRCPACCRHVHGKA